MVKEGGILMDIIASRSWMNEWPVLCCFLMAGAALLTKESRRVLYVFKRSVGYFCGCIINIIWMPLFLCRPFNPSNITLMREATNFVANLLGVKVVVRGTENLKKERSGVVVSNHQSTLDLLVVGELLSVFKKIVPIMKRELFFLLPFAINMWLSGAIFINRNDRENCCKGIGTAIEVAKRNSGCKVLIYPEGTRNKLCNDTKTFLPFKMGAFKAAIAAQLPIFPVVVSLQYFANARKWLFGRGTLYVEILPPIETTGLNVDNGKELKEKIQDLMQQTFDNLLREIQETHSEEFVKYTKCV